MTEWREILFGLAVLALVAHCSVIPEQAVPRQLTSRAQASKLPLLRLRGAGTAKDVKEGPEEELKGGDANTTKAEESHKNESAPIKRMSRAHSEITFPSMDSYAYSVESDLGFSLFLERRCKKVYFIGNAEGFHNTVQYESLLPENEGDEYYDSPLSPKGYDECYRLKMEILQSKHPIDFQLVVVSPLTRALQTAKEALGDLHRATPSTSRAASRCVSPQPEPLTSIHRNVTDPMHAQRVREMELLQEKLRGLELKQARSATTGTSYPTDSGKPRRKGQRIPMIATELCRERLTGLPCDRRRPISELKKEYPNVDFSLIKDDEDLLPERVLEDPELCKKRGAKFLQWICTRPEQRIAVVSHSGFLTHLFSQFGMNKFHALGRKDMGELHRRPLHAEMRCVLMAAHRRFEEKDVLLETPDETQGRPKSESVDLPVPKHLEHTLP